MQVYAPPSRSKSEAVAQVVWALHRWERGHLPWDDIPAYIGIAPEELARMEPILDLEPDGAGELNEAEMLRIVINALRL